MVFTVNFRRADSREHLVTSRRLVPAYSRGFTRVTSSTPRITSAVRSCRVKQLPPSRSTGLAPRRLGTRSPLSYVEDLYLLQYFPRLSPPPSGLRLGRVLRRLDRVLTVVQPIGLTVEPPTTTPARRPRGRGSEGFPDDLYSAHPRVYGGDARDGTLLGCIIRLFHHIRFP